MGANEQRARELLAATCAGDSQALADSCAGKVPLNLAIRAIMVALAQQVPADGECKAWSVVGIGNRGEAYDGPKDCRAYTYQHQPGNLEASRLGNAAHDAMNMRAGDSIDRGLCLLKALQAHGFGVFQLSAATPQAPQPVVDASQPQQGAVAWVDPRDWKLFVNIDQDRPHAARKVMLARRQTKLRTLPLYTTIGQQAVDDAELAEFVRGIYQRMNESYVGGRRILFQDMDYLFDFATKRRIILSQVPTPLAAHGKGG